MAGGDPARLGRRQVFPAGGRPPERHRRVAGPGMAGSSSAHLDRPKQANHTRPDPRRHAALVSEGLGIGSNAARQIRILMDRQNLRRYSRPARTELSAETQRQARQGVSQPARRNRERCETTEIQPGTIGEWPRNEGGSTSVPGSVPQYGNFRLSQLSLRSRISGSLRFGRAVGCLLWFHPEKRLGKWHHSRPSNGAGYQGHFRIEVLDPRPVSM